MSSNQSVSDMFQPADCQCFGGKTSSKKRNFLFNLPQKCLLISQLTSNHISTVSNWCKIRTRWFCICIYIFICILHFNSPLSRFHCFHLVKPGQDDFDLVLLWWLSNLVFYLRPKFLSMKVFACFSLNQQPDSNAALPWPEKKSSDLGNNIGTFVEKLSRTNILLHVSISIWMTSTFAICSFVNIFIVGWFYEKCPKSISLFPCMTMKAFYMISSQHTTAALSLFLIATKNTQVSLISFVGICFCLYFGFAFTKF